MSLTENTDFIWAIHEYAHLRSLGEVKLKGAVSDSGESLSVSWGFPAPAGREPATSGMYVPPTP